ncbi:amidohydrolase family protein [Chloroflexota bacterium]
MTIEREIWLKMTREEPLEPDLPICDPHHHFWDHPDDFPLELIRASHRITRHYLLKNLLEDISGGHNILQTVFMECTSVYRKDGPQELKPIGETEFVRGIAAQSASGQFGDTNVAAGIIGFADLTLGSAVAPVLEAQIEAGGGRFRGIRNISTWDASSEINSRVSTPTLLSDPKFREGFTCLNKYNLSFDSWLYHTQLTKLADLARAFPDTPIILNHIGGPLGIGPYAGKRKQVFREWQQGIAVLATCPNVVVKLGGIGMPLTGFGWHEQPAPPNSIELAKLMAPYVNWCIEQFGVERCMFESNFPVDRISYSYTTVWNTFKRITKDFSTGERSWLFHDTAVKVYRLKTNSEG